MLIMAIIQLFVTMFIISSASVTDAGSGWEMSIKAEINQVESRLFIGQKPDATDGVDGLHDVPALISGSIEAFIDLQGDAYWKSIQEDCGIPCRKVWHLFVRSGYPGQIIELSWNASDVPGDTAIVLIDNATGEVLDMKQAERVNFKNSGEREFIIEVTK